MMNEYPKKISVLIAEPGKPFRIRRIVPAMDVMGRIVGGNAAEIWPFAGPVAIIYNNCGDELNLPGRYLLRNGSGEPYAVIRGTFLAVGVSNGNYVSLTDSQIMRFLTAFSRDRLSGAKHLKQRYPPAVGI